MTTYTVPSWLQPQTMVPPTLRRRTFAHEAKYSGASDIVDMLGGDTWTMAITLPPCKLSQSGRREAFVNKLIGGSNLLQAHHFGRPVPRGTMRGSPVLSAAAAVGAQVLQVSGATAGVNLLRGGSFEVDANADGAADPWALVLGGSGDPTRTHLIGVTATATHGAVGQYVGITGGVSTGVDSGIYQPTTTPIAGGQAYTFSFDALASIAGKVCGQVLALDAGGSVLGSYVTGYAGTAAMGRLSVTFTAPPTATQVRVLIRGITLVGEWMRVDSAQLELGAVASPYAGVSTLLEGDMLGVGGQLFQVAQDTALNDLGTGTIPVVNRVRTAIASGSAVTWNQPTALWRLANTPALLMQPGSAQGITLELVERAY